MLKRDIKLQLTNMYELTTLFAHCAQQKPQNTCVTCTVFTGM